MTNSSSQALVPLLTSIGPHILGTKQTNLAFYAVFVYDSLLTFPEEIEHIWKKRFSLVTVLYFFNRYYAFTVLTICIVANLSPLFTPEICQRFSPFFVYAGGTVLTIMPDIVLALRVYALYETRRSIAILLMMYLTAELSVALWIYGTRGGHPLALPSAVASNLVFHLCIEEPASSLGYMQAAAFQFMQTVYDTCVFSLIIYKVLSAVRGPKNADSIQKLMAKHGLTYYALLFSANLTWAMMIILAPVGLKYSAASPTLCLACTMVNRITLSLRSYTSKPSPDFKTEIAMYWSLPPVVYSSGSDSTTIRTISDGAYETEHSGSKLSWPASSSYELDPPADDGREFFP